MKVRVLGSLEVVVGDEVVALGGPRRRALLALLIAEAPNAVPADTLITGVWGEDASSNNRSSLQTHVSNLRHLLGGRIIFDSGAYRLDVDPPAIDAHEFVEILNAARTRIATDATGVSQDLRRALALWRGRPYSDVIDVPQLEQEVRRLEALRLEAVELRVEAELAEGNHAQLVAELEALAEAHPTRERFRAQHMIALYRSGRQADALRAYRRTESFLAEELGVSPSRELQDLEMRILEHDDSLSAGVSTPVTHRLAFLVTDIEGSTTHWDRQPQAMAAALTTHDAILREEVERAGGRVFKHTGDGVLAVLPNAVSAADAAEGVQTRVARTDWGEVGDLRVRIGIDAGEAEERGGDFFGPPLNRAARLCAIGHGGQVLVSTAAERDITSTAPAGLQVRHLGEVHLRGMATPERIAQLVFVGLPADFPELRLDTGSTLEARTELLSLPGYEVRDRIGEGAFGVIWRAYQPSVGREVAVKVIRPELAAEPSFVRRFEAEARTIARLAHPHIVPLIDFWRTAESAYLVLALLPGGSLSDALRGTQIDSATARRILTQLATALDHAHSQGIAHGDLKASNVLLDGAGNAYLSDFGIAGRLLDREILHSVSSAPQYRAPEEAVTGPTPVADRFALGVLAGDLLGGHPEVESTLARATAHRPEDRYSTALSFVRDLEASLGGDIAELGHVAVTRNPYKGLRPFDEGDAADFHGRDDLVAAIVTALRRNRFVTVVGPSGSGKSSVVRSGVVPRLVAGREPGLERCLVMTFTPGTNPVDGLIQVLSGVAGNGLSPTDLSSWFDRVALDGEPVLVVDQFEELYTHVDDPHIRSQFIDLLVEATEKGGRVLATLRADYYDRPLGDERIARLIRDGQVTVLPPTRDELVEMVTAPARAVGLRWEPGLPHRIVEDVAHQPGGLPLLQYALTELVERRAGDLLTASDYHRIGEVTGALAHRAEALFAGLTPAQQAAARQILLRLVTVDEDTDDTRRRVRRGELESLPIAAADLDYVLDLFTSERLLLGDRDPVSRTPTVEVSHEALLREWPRLRGWIDDQRESLILGRRYRAAMAEWESNDRHDDYLLGGSRLASFVGWAEASSLTPDERDFYQSSRARDEMERSARRRRRRTLTSILAAAAVVGLTLGTVAALQAGRANREAEAAVEAEQRAESEAQRAELSAATARSRELAASAEAALDTDPSLAKLLAVASTRYGEATADTLSILHRTFAADPVLSQYSWPSTELHGADLHPDGSLIAATGNDPARLEVYDMEAGRLVWAWESAGGTFVDRAHFSVDGQHVLAGVIPDGENPVGETGIHMWDTDTGELVRIFDMGACSRDVVAVTASRAFTLHPSGECNGEFATIGMLELESGDWTELVAEAHSGAVSGDGQVVAYSDALSSYVLEVDTGEVVLEFARSDHPGFVPDGFVQALNEDGSLLLAGERPIAVWDVAAGEIVAQFAGHPGEAEEMVFDAEGETVYSSGREDTVRKWSIDGTEIESFPAVGAGPLSLAGDRILVSDWATDRITLVDGAMRGEVWSLPTCPGFVVGGGLARVDNGLALAQVCGEEGESSTFLIDAETRQVTEWPLFFGQSQAISPDGTRLVRQEQVSPPKTTDDGLVQTVGPPVIRDLATGESLLELEGACVYELGAAFTPETADQCEEYPQTPFAIFNWQLGWSADASHVINVRPGVTVWDAATGEIVATVDAETNESCTPFHMLVDPAGDRVLFGCEAGPGRVAELSTETWDFSVIEVEALRGGAPAGLTPDGESIVNIRNFGSFGATAIEWLDAETFEIEATFEEITQGSVKSHALSPDGRLLALGTSEGFVHVWDIVDRRVVQEIFVAPTQMQGVAFLSDTHLAVAPQPGGVLVYSLDPDELFAIVAESLSRGFTPAECDRYRFGEDCPTLAELQAAEGVEGSAQGG
ncbi:MAG TPA: BTAD domain-containing putative transcriptional regulator [Acidimicrobiia bacterium]|nr:BTAD domain-containing putative transcriptional regulator [Acidimicrobiia bacterium]